MSKERPWPEHILGIMKNRAEVDLLVEIHSKIGDRGPGRRRNIEVLNRSAIVLLVACWEAYVEDLADIAFDFLLKHARRPTDIPKKVLSMASKELREHKDPVRVWELAADGWKKVLAGHKEDVKNRYVGRLNSPRPDTIDELFESLIGAKSLSREWKWQSSSNKRTLERLDQLITLRGSIAHRVSASTPVHRGLVQQANDLVGHLSAILSNQVANHLYNLFAVEPWIFVKYANDGASQGLPSN